MSAEVSATAWGAYCAACGWGTEEPMEEDKAAEVAHQHDREEHRR